MVRLSDFPTDWKHYAAQGISFLFIFLFSYTATSKLLDFEIFRIRLDQSPMLEGMGNGLAVGILIVLLITAILLLFERTRLRGMYAALGLMFLFTGYIAVVLGFYSSSLPCSCNGVFESVTWTQHLWINVGFTGLAVLGIIMHAWEEKNKKN